MNLYGLIGFPLSHSFSKEYFTNKFEREGLQDFGYELFPIESITQLKDLLKDHPSLKGLNITIPHKRSVFEYLDDISGIPEKLHSCNCIKIKEGKLHGYNTDITGFERSILPHLQSHHTKALILGNGGAAAAVKFVFEKNSIAYSIAGRTAHQDVAFNYKDLNEKIISEHTIIVNTTPLGTFPAVDNCPDIPYHFIGPQHHLFDVVYNPERSLFLQKGERQGATIQNGYKMLVIQAEESWNIWMAH